MAQLVLAIAKFRCIIRELLAGLLMSWIRGNPGLSRSFVTEPHILLCHYYYDVALLVGVLLLFVEVGRSLVKHLSKKKL